MSKSKIDWSKLTPKQICAALENLPKDIAGPWQRPHKGYYVRYSLRGSHDNIANINKELNGWDVWLDPADANPRFKTLKAAKEAADKLLKKAGWRLV
jgi:hypothetical protein